MSKLIDDFKKEHKIVLDAILELISKEFTAKEKHKKIFELKPVLIEHLLKENDELYGPLLDGLKNIGRLSEECHMLSSSMVETTNFVLGFYDDHKSLTDEDKFLDDLNKFCLDLSIRIAEEENNFFTEYEKLFDDEL